MKDGQRLGPPRDWEVPGTYRMPVDHAAMRSLQRRGEARSLAADLRDMRTIEAEHVARREAATTEAERDAADGLLSDIRAQIADAQRRYTLVKINKDGSRIRDEWDAKVREIAEALRASQHEGYTKEYRDSERARLNAEFQRTTNHYRALLDQWYAQQRTAAQAAYEQEPEGDAATEMRRLRFRDEVRSLAEQYAGDTAKMQARNILLPEARRLATIGAMDKAHLYAEAARRHGATDPKLDVAVKQHLDRTEPHRREAIDAMQAIEGEMVEFRLGAVKARAMYGFGTPSQQAVARDNANFLEWKKQREDAFIAEANGGQATPITTDDAEPAVPSRSA